jgi:hypothetical protein
MRVAEKMNDSYDYMDPQHTGYRDFSAQLILLIHLPLGYTDRLWGIQAVYLALISSLLAYHMLHGLSKKRIQLRLTPLDSRPL